MTLTDATKTNLVRKAHWADHLQLIGNTPVFSWLDISPVDLCNRSCVFCPRSDPKIMPNQKLYMSLELGTKMATELHSIEYEGAVIFCGTGEPLLHPRFLNLLEPFAGLRTELVTNGDRLTADLVARLYDAGLCFINVSMYDGEHQIDHFEKMFAGYGYNDYILRDRWYGADEDYGVKLTNRAGTTEVGRQPEVDQDHACYYPSYCMTVDWDGRVLLCPQDWHRRVVYGNINEQTMWEIWTSRAMHKRRTQLQRGRADLFPCAACNADGCLHGDNHVTAWRTA